MAALDTLRSLLEETDIEVDEQSAVLMAKHLEAVMTANERMNLTAIRDLDLAVLLHVIDSLMCVNELAQAPKGAFVDLGSGAGFPGIPLAIASGRDAVLVESVAKKASFLEETVGLLGLDGQIRVLAVRSEELARQEPSSFAAVTARAVSALPALVELAAPLLVTGGRLIAMKGRLDPAELESGRAVAALTGTEFESLREYLLPDRGDARSCVTFVKRREGSIPLPRRDGMAQRRTLG